MRPLSLAFVTRERAVGLIRVTFLFFAHTETPALPVKTYALFNPRASLISLVFHQRTP